MVVEDQSMEPGHCNLTQGDQVGILTAWTYFTVSPYSQGHRKQSAVQVALNRSAVEKV
jgi:hypothetical protein